MQTSKQIVELQRREQKARAVVVRLASSTTKGFNFNVHKDADTKKTKYIGTISEDHTDDSCTCQKENPLPFTCEHIIKAHSMMEGFW